MIMSFSTTRIQIRVQARNGVDALCEQKEDREEYQRGVDAISSPDLWRLVAITLSGGGDDDEQAAQYEDGKAQRLLRGHLRGLVDYYAENDE
jgi:hypothetical protein